MTEKEFLEQVRENQGIIYKLVGLYATGAEEKKDLCQEVLLQCWKALPSFRGEAKFSTWLYRICLNTILTQKRKISFIDYRESLEDIAPGLVNSNDENKSLEWALRQLAETDRAIISMHLDGYDNTEIAAVIGIAASHIAVKLHRIKKHLTTLLKTDL
ncbi:MAG: sigma-70 family RNA polymerase sigma factor [Ferruginibacter sp.]